MPGAGLEPARPYGQEILSLSCLPFHHPGAPLCCQLLSTKPRGIVPRLLSLLPHCVRHSLSTAGHGSLSLRNARDMLRRAIPYARQAVVVLPFLARSARLRPGRESHPRIAVLQTAALATSPPGLAAGHVRTFPSFYFFLVSSSIF